MWIICAAITILLTAINLFIVKLDGGKLMNQHNNHSSKSKKIGPSNGYLLINIQIFISIILYNAVNYKSVENQLKIITMFLFSYLHNVVMDG